MENIFLIIMEGVEDNYPSYAVMTEDNDKMREVLKENGYSEQDGGRWIKGSLKYFTNKVPILTAPS